MKTRTKIILSLLAGLLAMMLSASPMWWGVLFSPITQQLATEASIQDTEGICWEMDGVVLRFKTLDMLLSFLHSS